MTKLALRALTSVEQKVQGMETLNFPKIPRFTRRVTHPRDRANAYGDLWKMLVNYFPAAATSIGQVTG
jgi:hypothetical protein